jgi:pimeloyl-ACP methyl ester carboxylesterase
MTPYHFGHGTRRLFGAYSPAQTGTGSAGRRAVVLCHPWGQEYLRAHRSLRQLATMLSGAGFHVLRFDYFGTGDSSGDMVDADLRGWVADIGTAMEEIRDTTGAARVGLVGLRLGAVLASMAAAQRPRQVESIVLWDPVVSGSEYRQELLDMQVWTPQGLVKPIARPDHAGGGHEVVGFPLTAGMATEIDSIDLPSLVPALPARLLAVASRPHPSWELLQRALDQRPSGPLPIEQIPCLPAWLEDEDSGAGAVPIRIMQRIVQWLK